MKKYMYFHCILTISILIFLGQILYLYHIEFFDATIVATLFIPVIIVLIVYLFQFLTNNKWKILCYILSSIILLKQILVFCLLFLFHYMSIHDNWYYKEYNNIDDYKTAIKELNCKKCIKHFPNNIPNNAKNIEFFQQQSYWWGSENIFLKFETNDKYLENEIQKYDKNKIGENTPKQVFPFDTSDYNFYVVFYKTGRFLKEGGIGINNKNNSILYYYNNPDD